VSHFAKVEDGVVTQVIVISNSVIGEPTAVFPETETMGRKFISKTLGFSGDWYQTSYNGNFRGVYAGIGYKYDSELDEFISPTTEIE